MPAIIKNSVPKASISVAGIEKIRFDKTEINEISPNTSHENAQVATVADSVIETAVRSFTESCIIIFFFFNLKFNGLKICVITMIPSVARNDIQNPMSISAGGEITKIMNAEAKRAVRLSESEVSIYER